MIHAAPRQGNALLTRAAYDVSRSALRLRLRKNWLTHGSIVILSFCMPSPRNWKRATQSYRTNSPTNSD